MNSLTFYAYLSNEGMQCGIQNYALTHYEINQVDEKCREEKTSNVHVYLQYVGHTLFITDRGRASGR